MENRQENIHHIHFPRSLSELAVIMEENNRFCFYWGNIQKSENLFKLKFPESTLISLHYIDELKRITRSERYIEAGSAVTIRELLLIASMVLPLPFISLIEQQFSLPYRNQITLGGLLHHKKETENILSLLFHLLDILLEVRSKKSSRKRSSLKSSWFYYNQYINEEMDLQKDILSTFRIPLIRWEQHLIRTIRFSGGLLHMIVLTDISRGYISDFRMGFQYSNLPVIRNREWEANIMGRKEFFSQKEQEGIYDYLITQGVPDDPIYLKPALMMNLDNLLYHFQDSGY